MRAQWWYRAKIDVAGIEGVVSGLDRCAWKWGGKSAAECVGAMWVCVLKAHDQRAAGGLSVHTTEATSRVVVGSARGVYRAASCLRRPWKGAGRTRKSRQAYCFALRTLW